jgi:hypothetical protein
MAQSKRNVKQTLSHARTTSTAIPTSIRNRSQQLRDFRVRLHGGADGKVDVSRGVGAQTQFCEFVVQVVQIEGFDGAGVVESCEVLDEIVVAAGYSPAFDARAVGGEFGVAQLGRGPDVAVA